MIQIRLTGMSPRQVQVIAITLYYSREDIPTYNNGSSIAQHWEPTVRNDGASDGFIVTTPAIPLNVAASVTKALQDLET